MLLLKNILTLDFSKNKISNRGAEYLSNCSFLSKLKFLGLENNNIDEKGEEILSSGEYFINLTILEI